MPVVETVLASNIDRVWTLWTTPEHITKWYFASDDWHAPAASNDLRVGGSFSTRMETKNGSFGFDYGGKYDEIDLHKKIAYTLGDGRRVVITFAEVGDADTIRITESFEPETTLPIEQQTKGWQCILDNFKKYVGSSN